MAVKDVIKGKATKAIDDLVLKSDCYCPECQETYNMFEKYIFEGFCPECKVRIWTK